MELNDKIDEAIAGALGDAYDCTRAWKAWSYGTMSADDFIEVREQSDRIADIREAVLAVLRTQEPAAWLVTGSRVLMDVAMTSAQAADRRISERGGDGSRKAPLYAAPVPPAESAVPDGWKLVPVEPTPEMVQAGWEEHEGSVEGVYLAMLAAAPKPEGE